MSQQENSNKQSRTEGLIVGLIVGVLVTTPLIFFDHNVLLNRILDKVGYAFTLVLFIVLALVFASLFKERIINLFFRGVEGTVTRSIDKVNEIAIQCIDRDPKGIVQNSSTAVKEIFSWYSWVTLRKWLVNSAIGLMIGFAGVVGTLLLHKQNGLLDAQNKTLEEQKKLFVEQNVTIQAQKDLIKRQNDLFGNQVSIEKTKLLDYLRDKHDSVIQSQELALDKPVANNKWTVKSDIDCLKYFSGDTSVQHSLNSSCRPTLIKYVQYLNFHERVIDRIKDGVVQNDDTINEFSPYWQAICQNSFSKDLITVFRINQNDTLEEFVKMTENLWPDIECTNSEIVTVDDFLKKYK